MHMAIRQYMENFDQRNSLVTIRETKSFCSNMRESIYTPTEIEMDDRFSLFPPTRLSILANGKEYYHKDSFCSTAELITPTTKSTFQCRSSEPLITNHDTQQIVPSLKDYQVYLVGVEDCLDHYNYVFRVETGNGQWKILHKRFSEFYMVRKKLSQHAGINSHCGKGVCRHVETLLRLKFPSRHFLGSRTDMDLAKSRMMRLSIFLESWLKLYRVASRRDFRCCASRNCMVLNELLQFLELPSINEMQDELFNTTLPIVKVPTATPWRPYRSMNSS